MQPREGRTSFSLAGRHGEGEEMTKSRRTRKSFAGRREGRRTFQDTGTAPAKAWEGMADARNPDSSTGQNARRVGARGGAWPYLAMGNHVITLSQTDWQNKGNTWLGQVFSTKLKRPLRPVACYWTNRGKERELMT